MCFILNAFEKEKNFNNVKNFFSMIICLLSKCENYRVNTALLLILQLLHYINHFCNTHTHYPHILAYKCACVCVCLCVWYEYDLLIVNLCIITPISSYLIFPNLILQIATGFARWVESNYLWYLFWNKNLYNNLGRKVRVKI